MRQDGAGQDRHRRAIHSFDRQFVRFFGLESADVAWHVKGEHLAAPVAGELHRAEHAAHHQIEVFRRIAFAHHLLSALEGNDKGVEVRKARRQKLADTRRALDGMVERIRHAATAS